MGVLDGEITETQFIPLNAAGLPQCEATTPYVDLFYHVCTIFTVS